RQLRRFVRGHLAEWRRVVCLHTLLLRRFLVRAAEAHEAGDAVAFAGVEGAVLHGEHSAEADHAWGAVDDRNAAGKNAGGLAMRAEGEAARHAVGVAADTVDDQRRLLAGAFATTRSRRRDRRHGLN